MGKKSTTPPDFKIHVDASCLTDSTDLEMPTQRNTSDQTVVLHDTTEAQESSQQTPSAEEQTEEIHHGNETPQQHRERLNERIEAEITAAARRVVENLEREKYEDQNESLLSAQTDESYEDGTELTYDGTEMTYDGTEGTYESEGEHGEQAEEAYEPESELDAHLEQALTAWEPSHDEGQNAREAKEWEPDHGEHSGTDHGDSSSQHDGDIDDDVFSRNSGNSQRSSMNSLQDLHSSDEVFQKTLTSPAVGEEAATSHEEETVSRVPSISSYTPDESNLRTPSKVLNRPPFRTPSSVRAMRMSSPTPSMFSSPRSTKRHLPTVSRSGTPTSQYSPSKRTPTRFKAKKEQPLVLLHVTVMPLQWPLAHAMNSTVPESLQHVKESWLMLQDKLADTVLERGILLPHPQDSYEVLEERLLEALELPVRPRAQILKCGHYMGPTDIETPSSDDEGGDTYFVESTNGRKWCDICRKDVKLENTGEMSGKRRFNLKIYASNGLMRAGAWAAAWREMERVDVEIEPWVETGLRSELEHLASVSPLEPVQEEEDDDDGFVDEDELVEESGDKHAEAEQRALAEEEELRLKIQEEEMAHRIFEEEEALRRKQQDEERLREIYGTDHRPQPDPVPHSQHTPHTFPQQQTINTDSLPELLLAACKVLLRDKKNIAIGILSILVLFLALRPGSGVSVDTGAITGLGHDLPAIASRDKVNKVVGDMGRVVESVVEVPTIAVRAKETQTLQPVPEVEINESAPQKLDRETVVEQQNVAEAFHIASSPETVAALEESLPEPVVELVEKVGELEAPAVDPKVSTDTLATQSANLETKLEVQDKHQDEVKKEETIMEIQESPEEIST